MNTTGMFTTTIDGRDIAAVWMWDRDESGRKYVHLDEVYDEATGEEIDLTPEQASELCRRIADDYGEYAERRRNKCS